MKKHLLKTVIVLIVLFSQTTLSAEANLLSFNGHKDPKWVSSLGFWVVESNLHTPKTSTIYFYNNEKILVYKENIQGTEINLNRKKVKMNLKKVLEESVIAFAKTKKMEENNQLVAMLMDGREK